ncbi:MAG: Ldh family oxidoreductase [Bacillota bacterium]|jgi:LDH2 family malate/lactate/ureidoglycolate dehydrogenase
METETKDYVRIPAPELKKTVAELLEQYDVPPAHAGIVSDVLVSADLRGVESHGIGRLYSYYISRFEQGYMNPRPSLLISRNFGATFNLDGDNGLGHVACHEAMKKCIDLAGKFGIGLGGIKNSNHFGIAGYYSMMALQEGMIGICISNSQPLALPTFSKKRLLGTNPLSIAVPAGKSQPFVLDMATSVVPIGKIEVHRRKEIKVPSEWGADSHGLATSDPAQILEGGGLFPLGGPAETAGYKGYGLSAAIDILAGVLTGSSFLAGVLNARVSPEPTGVGHFVAAIQVEAFMDAAEFRARMDRFIAELKNAPLADGCEKIYIAGEKEFSQWEQNIKDGVPVHKKVRDELAALCLKHNIPFPETHSAQP